MTEIHRWCDRVTADMPQRYADDGILFIPQLLQQGWLDLIELGIRRNVLSPGPSGIVMNPNSPGSWFMNQGNYAMVPEYQYLLEHSPIADVMRYVLESENLWLYYDQTFVKAGGANERTPWHQDLPFWIVDGPKLGSMWISIDPVEKEYCLEVVPGSHKGVQYGGINIEADSDQASYASLPQIPNIDGDREAWNIVSWKLELGDVLIIHPGVLHGGAGTGPGGQRRTASFRFFGDSAVMTGRFAETGERPNPDFPALDLRLRPGEPLRDPRFPLIRSGPATELAN